MTGSSKNVELGTSISPLALFLADGLVVRDDSRDSSPPRSPVQREVPLRHDLRLALETLTLPAPAYPGLEPTIEGRYGLERELGRGGMGRVHLARDFGLDRPVALKTIDPSLANRPSILSCFHRETAALSNVNSEHVVQFYALGRHEDSPFFAMEFVEGFDLASLIASYKSRGGLVPLGRAAAILRQIARGLAAVHSQGIVHRDLKPANVLIEARTGRAVLIDFGLAHTTTAVATTTHAGTPIYMSPEQWTESAVTSCATDIYGFGVLAFELLTSAPPYVAESTAALMLMHLRDAIPRAAAHCPALAPLDAVLTRALAKAPGDRFPHGEALAQALDVALAEALQGESSMALPWTWVPPPPLR